MSPPEGTTCSLLPQVLERERVTPSAVQRSVARIPHLGARPSRLGFWRSNSRPSTSTSQPCLHEGAPMKAVPNLKVIHLWRDPISLQTSRRTRSGSVGSCRNLILLNLHLHMCFTAWLRLIADFARAFPRQGSPIALPGPARRPSGNE